MTTEQQLREALEFYADRGNYYCPESQIPGAKFLKTNADEGERARAALALPSQRPDDEGVDDEKLVEVVAGLYADATMKGEAISPSKVVKAIRPYLRAKPDAGLVEKLEKIRFKKAAHPLKSPGWIEAIDACITIAPQHTRADHVQEMNTSQAPAGEGVVDDVERVARAILVNGDSFRDKGTVIELIDSLMDGQIGDEARFQAKAAIAAMSGDQRRADNGGALERSGEMRGHISDPTAGESPAAPATSDWLPHHGWECPVPGDTMVEVKLKANCKPFRAPANQVCWRWGNPPADVIAYRIVKPGGGV